MTRPVLKGRRSASLAWALLAGGLAACVPSASAQPSIAPGPRDITVNATVLPSFLIGDHDRTRFGALEWLGGLELNSSDQHFGALSGITVSDDGSQFLAVTDNGFWVRGRVLEDDRSAPTGLTDMQLGPMLDRKGNPLNLKASADAESVTHAIVDGKPAYLVAFEREHRIELYAADAKIFSARPVRFAAPNAIRALGANKGIESIAVGPAGTPTAGMLVIIAERVGKASNDIPGWMRRPGAEYRPFHVRRRDDFDITDAAFLPDGDLLLLERRFSFLGGIFMRLRRIAAGDLHPGRVVDGPVLMTADFTHQIDNMEGLAVHRSKAGDIVVTMVSDDNRSILQRTLLLRFRLRPARPESKPLRRPQVSTE